LLLLHLEEIKSMCFSTTASFAAATVLGSIGILSLKKTTQPEQIPFAAIPLVFATQQFFEGFVWLGLLHKIPQNYSDMALNLFLVFAMVVWPLWVPTAIMLIEKNEKRKRILKFTLGIGVSVSSLSLIYLLTRHSEASINPYHIHYELEVNYTLKICLGILYLIPTILAQILSSNKKIIIMGSLVLCSYLISIFFFNDTVLSVWCFFSAIISVMIYYVISHAKYSTTES
jgi:hypothetical protein